MPAPLVCARCPATAASIVALEAHLVEAHCIAPARAQLEARQARAETNGHTRLAAAPAPAIPLRPSHAHVCPGCRMEIPCDWQSVAELEAQAHRLKILAGLWRARLQGIKIGAPRRLTFDVDAARALVAGGMSYRAVAAAVGASTAALYATLNPGSRGSKTGRTARVPRGADA